jgi:hypothetical protein
VGRANVACTACHTSADYFVAGTHDPDPRHGRTTLSAASCNDCHHTRSTLSCATCHDATALATRTDSVTLPLHLRPRGAPASRRVAFSHAPHAGEACASCHTSRASVAAVGACASCHESHHRWATDCTACHGTDVRTHHRAANHLACAQCHALPTLQLLTGNRAFCLSCHVDRREHHPDRECAPCHLQLSPADVRSRILGGRR